MTAALFNIESDDDVLILTPNQDMSELDFDLLLGQSSLLFQELDARSCDKVVIDLSQINYFGSSALGLFVKMWKRVSGTGGKMAVVCASEAQREIFEVTRLNMIWPILNSREEALASA